MQLNHDRIRTKLTDMAAAISRLKKLQALNRQAFLADEYSQDIARSRLLTAIEAALNICYHVAAKKLWRVPEDYAQCFTLLGEAKLISPALADRLATMARFRNRLVHLYWDIDYGQVHDIICTSLGDLEDFAREVARSI